MKDHPLIFSNTSTAYALNRDHLYRYSLRKNGNGYISRLIPRGIREERRRIASRKKGLFLFPFLIPFDHARGNTWGCHGEFGSFFYGPSWLKWARDDSVQKRIEHSKDYLNSSYCLAACQCKKIVSVIKPDF